MSKSHITVPEPAGKARRKLRVRRDPAPGTIVRGQKLRLYPKAEQATVIDMWRRRTRELWNLLLGIEMAAYSGTMHRPDLGWREIWVDVATQNHRLAEERRALRSAEGKELGREPVLPDATKMLARGLKAEPRLFVWENDLQKLMARLKQVPLTHWIGDMPSHAAQRVVKELVQALQAMLRERKRRTVGTGGRKTGFPRFKPNHYAEGSVYLANTQLMFDAPRARVKLPNGVGWMPYGGGRIAPGDKLMGARIWRRGEEWWLSPQFEIPSPAALPATGRNVGVKVAATTLATIYDGAAFEEMAMPLPDKRAARRLRLWSRKLARRLDAQKRRTLQLAARGRRQNKRVRARRSAGVLEASERVAMLQAHEAAVRNDILHKVSRRIVDSADHIAIESLDVAGMMRRTDHRAAKRQRRRLRRQKDGPIIHRAPGKVLRRANRRVAMARLLGYVKYKAADGARSVTETHMLLPRVQECAACNTLNMMMKDGRIRHQCDKCGAVMHRHLNAAENIEKSGRASLESGLEAAE